MQTDETGRVTGYHPDTRNSKTANSSKEEAWQTMFGTKFNDDGSGMLTDKYRVVTRSTEIMDVEVDNAVLTCVLDEFREEI